MQDAPQVNPMLGPRTLAQESQPIVPPDADPAPNPTLTQQFLFAFGVMILVFVSLRLLRKTQANRASLAKQTLEDPRERIERTRAEASDRQSIDTVMADATELTQRLAAQLENKAVRLETLIAEADDRLRRLEQAGVAAPSPTRPADNPSDLPPPVTGRSTAPPRRTPPPSTPAPDDAEPTPPGHARVFELADQGMTPVQIAREVNQPTGQVELILALRRRA